MRDIKFRAWDRRYSEMLKSRDIKNTTLGFLEDEGSSSNPLVFMQYIGVRDRNGKEIYEGDIVETNECGWIAKVIYYGDAFMCVDNKGGFSNYCDWEEFEVLGNIYENPELLEGGEAPNPSRLCL